MKYVLRVGGKQYCVSKGASFWVTDVVGVPGEMLTVSCLSSWDEEGNALSLVPTDILVRVVDVRKGPKIVGFTYKPKNNERTKFGYRSRQALLSVVA
ncbi:MAG: bL21 family ribosomal protein [Armatimonadetes bacterium]|nr:bL21 family ribosomal protein [Armatimonadota bacterium]